MLYAYNQHTHTHKQIYLYIGISGWKRYNEVIVHE